MSSIDFPSHENIFEITDTFNKIGVIHSLMETIPVEKFNALKLGAWEVLGATVHTAWYKWNIATNEEANSEAPVMKQIVRV